MSGMGGMMGVGVSPNQIVLNDVSELDSERFQQLWMQLPVACGGQAIQKTLSADATLNLQAIEGKFKDKKLSTMASG